MKISELITKLFAIKDASGDLEVVTGYTEIRGFHNIGHDFQVTDAAVNEAENKCYLSIEEDY